MSIVTDKSNFGNFYRPILAWLVALLFFFPIFWMIFTSFKTDADAVKPEFLFFFKPTLEATEIGFSSDKSFLLLKWYNILTIRSFVML